MKRLLPTSTLVVLAIVLLACKQESVPSSPTTVPAAAPKPGWEYTPEDFGIGHKSTLNAACNRQIDALREEIRTCFNTHAPDECKALQKKNTDRIGIFIQSPRCAK